MKLLLVYLAIVLIGSIIGWSIGTLAAWVVWND